MGANVNFNKCELHCVEGALNGTDSASARGYGRCSVAGSGRLGHSLGVTSAAFVIGWELGARLSLTVPSPLERAFGGSSLPLWRPSSF